MPSKTLPAIVARYEACTRNENKLVNVFKSLAVIPQPAPKSILKPTMPPLREIPAHISTRRGSPKKATPPSVEKTENLIDFEIDPAPVPTVTGTESLPNPFEVGGNGTVSETRVTLKTEEEQQAAAREREEQERAELEKQIISRRDARRKSLANRRVSFAPEATLHTWDVVVEYQDSTTSSNATNSTRRASNMTGGSIGSPHPNGSTLASSDPSEPPSTPPEQIEEDTVMASPAHQRDLHQKKQRRSSGIPPMNFNNPDDDAFSSSPFSGDSMDDGDEVVDDDGSNSNSDSADDDDDDDGTMMSLDGGDTTNMSMASMSDASTSSNTRLDEALRQAARQARTHEIDSNNGVQNVMNEEDTEIVASFAPWGKKKALQEMELQQDQENVNPFASASIYNKGASEDDAHSDEDEMTMEMTCAVGGIMPSKDANQEVDDDEMSMDVTRAFGGIISNPPQKLSGSRRKSMPANGRQTTRRRSSGEGSSFGDETMDLTQAIGGIQSKPDETVQSEDEDITMEFTSVVGGVLSQLNPTSRPSRRTSMAPPQKSNKKTRQSIESAADDETMDMTVAVGGIRPSLAEVSEPIEDETVGMEITSALGSILPPQRSTGSRLQAKKIMEMETDFGSSPFRVDPAPESPPKLQAPTHTVASETGSPSLSGFRGKGLRRSAEARQSSAAKSRLSSSGTPVKKPATPPKQLTPQPARPTTPGKTPPSKNIVMRTSSPKRLFKDEIKVISSTPQSATTKKIATPNKLFQRDKSTGMATPSFILTPKSRRSSGLGFDKAGLGSPRVAALLDRRGSIGENAKAFSPGQFDQGHHAVRFANPRAMEEEIDRERQKEEDRENGRSILEREADLGEDEKDVTLNLKEMISSLTPKKRPLRGRKSLHVGAAKGILGKRPTELDDEDEDDEDNGGVKRLKNHQGSPVKSIKLQAPPSKAETTTGRLTRTACKSIEEATISSLTPSTSSPAKAKATTPRHQGHFKDVEALTDIQDIAPPAEKNPVDDPEVDEESFGDDRIQLQDFLNMTSIRFMELTTTKRRHTIAPKTVAKGSEDTDKPIALEDCVAAGAATIPMLELFQHVSLPPASCNISNITRHVMSSNVTSRKVERRLEK
jgi:kinetochore protein Spc7/SPC105